MPIGNPAASDNGSGNGTGMFTDDVAALENAAECTLTGFCWWRTDIPRSVSETYWRDVHGVMTARVPGLWQYRQLRLGANRADLWLPVPGVSFEAALPAQPEGMQHASFLSEAHQAAFEGSPVVANHVLCDERNFVRRVVTQTSPTSAARTLADRVHETSLQGAPRFPSFAVCFMPAPTLVSVDGFHRNLAEIGQCWSEHPEVMRVRVQPLSMYDPTIRSSPGVLHDWPTAQSYLGWIELSVRDESVLAELHRVPWAAAIHTYPISEVYTIVARGRPTEVGLRGFPAFQTILAAGAEEQRTARTLAIVYGEAVRGIDRLC
jgi:hypothetical protein